MLQYFSKSRSPLLHSISSTLKNKSPEKCLAMNLDLYIVFVASIIQIVSVTSCHYCEIDDYNITSKFQVSNPGILESPGHFA
jgi:hypothetical protein